VSDIGDALTRGFRPFPLRECATITIEQEVQLPRGSTPASVPVTFDIAPYGRELDSVFVACGETSAYGAEAAPPRKVAESARPAPPPARAAPAAPSPPSSLTAPSPPAPIVAAVPDQGWRSARAVTDGKTNVRAKPSVQSPLVTQLHPGAVLLVQPAGPDWWRVRPSSGAAFEGYVRGDRLIVR
jgi:hypothetical protein